MNTYFLGVVSEEDKKKDDGKYYYDWADFILSRYNSQTYRSAYDLNIENIPISQRELYTNPVGAIKRNFAYYGTVQDNKQFSFVSTDLNNQALPTGQVWQRVPKITNLINDLDGDFLKNTQYQRLAAESVSPSAENEKTQKLKLTSIKQQNRELFMELEELGIGFNPLGGVEDEFETIDEAQAYIENDYKTPLEAIGDVIKDDVIERNEYEAFKSTLLKYAAIGGVVATEIDVQNGRAKWNTYLPERIIWDNSQDRQFHKDFRFLGLIDYKTPSEIISIYGDELRETKEGKEALERIKNFTYNQGIGNKSGTLSLFGMSGNIPTICVIKNYWKAIKKTDSEEYITYETCVKIGDIITVRKGEVSNIVEHYRDKKIVFPPVILWTPDMTDGVAHSFVSRMVPYQDLLDLYKNRLNDLVIRSYGKAIFIDGAEMSSTSYDEIVNQLRRFGIAAVNTSDGSDDLEPNRPMISVYDTSNYQEIQTLLSLIRQEEVNMEAVISTNDVTLGQQEQYLSAVTQKTTIDQAKKGTYGFYQGYLHYIESLVQLSVNIQKDLFAKNGGEYAIPLLSRFGESILKKIEDLPFETFSIKFKFLEPITDLKSQEIINYIKQESLRPDGFITPEDFAKAISFKNYPDLIRYFTKITKRAKKEKQQQEEIALNEARLARQEEQNNAIASQIIAEQGANQRDALKAETSLLANQRTE